jgi:hypothetical protein
MARIGYCAPNGFARPIWNMSPSNLDYHIRRVKGLAFCLAQHGQRGQILHSDIFLSEKTESNKKAPVGAFYLWLLFVYRIT